MTPKLRIAAITDEFSPDLEVALDAMEGIGMTGAELRVLWGKNIMNLSQDELNRARDLVQSKKHGSDVDRFACLKVRAAECAGC